MTRSCDRDLRVLHIENFKWYHKITDRFQFGGKTVHLELHATIYKHVDLFLGVKNAEKVNVNCEGTGKKDTRRSRREYSDHWFRSCLRLVSVRFPVTNFWNSLRTSFLKTLIIHILTMETVVQLHIHPNLLKFMKKFPCTVIKVC